MSLEVRETDGGNVLEVHVSGKLTTEDYERFSPEVERMIGQHGKIRVLLDMHDFHGWSAGALWQDSKFNIKHFKDIERLAMVGEKAWEKGMSTFCKPFTTATVRYFERSQEEEARRWVKEQ